MRVALIYNAEAGEGVYDRKDLERLLRDEGCDVFSYGWKDRDIATAIANGGDILAVAGGDGTVARTAIALHDCSSSMPLFILPVGTSNNIARSLCIDATIPVLIKSLGTAQPIPFDIGRASASWGNAFFAEATGVGFIGTMLHSEDSLRTKLEHFLYNLRPATPYPFEMAARGVARLIRRQRARHYEIVADDEDLSGTYLAVEAMNIKWIGPRVALAPHADEGDHMLDLLLVHPEDRAALADYVASMGASGPLPPARYRRVRRVEMSWASGVGHLDDEPWPAGNDADSEGQSRVVIELHGSIEVLRSTSYNGSVPPP